MKNVHYSDEFKQQVLNILGNFDSLKNLLDNGDLIIGEFLYSIANSIITPEDIVKEFENNNSTALLERSKKIIASKLLYEEWNDNYLSKIIDKSRVLRWRGINGNE